MKKKQGAALSLSAPLLLLLFSGKGSSSPNERRQHESEREKAGRFRDGSQRAEIITAPIRVGIEIRPQEIGIIRIRGDEFRFAYDGIFAVGGDLFKKVVPEADFLAPIFFRELHRAFAFLENVVFDVSRGVRIKSGVGQGDVRAGIKNAGVVAEFQIVADAGMKDRDLLAIEKILLDLDVFRKPGIDRVHAISALYLIILLYRSFSNLKAKHLEHGLAVLVCSLFVVLAVIIESLSDSKSNVHLLNLAIAVSTMLYYLYPILSTPSGISMLVIA